MHGVFTAATGEGRRINHGTEGKLSRLCGLEELVSYTLNAVALRSTESWYPESRQKSTQAFCWRTVHIEICCQMPQSTLPKENQRPAGWDTGRRQAQQGQKHLLSLVGCRQEIGKGCFSIPRW